MRRELFNCKQSNHNCPGTCHTWVSMMLCTHAPQCWVNGREEATTPRWCIWLCNVWTPAYHIQQKTSTNQTKHTYRRSKKIRRDIVWMARGSSIRKALWIQEITSHRSHPTPLKKHHRELWLVVVKMVRYTRENYSVWVRQILSLTPHNTLGYACSWAHTLYGEINSHVQTLSFIIQPIHCIFALGKSTVQSMRGWTFRL